MQKCIRRKWLKSACQIERVNFIFIRQFLCHSKIFRNLFVFFPNSIFCFRLYYYWKRWCQSTWRRHFPSWTWIFILSELLRKIDSQLLMHRENNIFYRLVDWHFKSFTCFEHGNDFSLSVFVFFFCCEDPVMIRDRFYSTL